MNDLTDERAEKIKEIAREATVFLNNAIGTLGFNLEESYGALLLCSSLITAAIISSEKKRMNHSADVILKKMIKITEDALKCYK